jgi:crotonobetainyl-CoA:carnitine CoA-transferase CaiB-like acyl-CoA transferase
LTPPEHAPDALEGLRVIDAGTLLAGPVVASLMADFGADVIKIEHPRGDPLRSLDSTDTGESLWWALASRNKRCVTVNLSHPRGQELAKRLLRDADVLVESFRPGTLERWNLAPETLHELNPRLIIVRTTGFGQTGPYSSLPGFGTIAEAMSGFAYVNGWPDRPPSLPPMPLADGVAALAACAVAMFAVWWRDHAGQGKGQVVDVSLLESLFWLLGPQATAYERHGVVPERIGNLLPFTAPRNVYPTSDGRWITLSASSTSIAARLMRVVGRADLVGEPWFDSNAGRAAHADELDAAVAGWVGERTAAEAISVLREAEAAAGPVYSIADIAGDQHYRERGTLVHVDDPALGPLLMQNMIARLSRTPGKIRHAGASLGEHNDEVITGELGLSADEIAELSQEGIV